MKDLKTIQEMSDYLWSHTDIARIAGYFSGTNYTCFQDWVDGGNMLYDPNPITEEQIEDLKSFSHRRHLLMFTEDQLLDILLEQTQQLFSD